MTVSDQLTPDQIREMIAELRNFPLRKDDVVLMDYQSEYLSSNLWRRTKRRILKRDKNICGCCGGAGKIVHHRSYEREVLEGNADHLLTTVCEGCHNIIHFDDKGTRRTLEEADQVFLAGQRQVHFPTPRIDLRRITPILPGEWPRMTAMQKKLWHEKFMQLLRERKRALAAKRAKST